MTIVEMEYRPFGLLSARRMIAKMPTGWNDLSGPQFIALNRNAIKRKDEVHLITILLSVKKSIAKRLDAYQRFSILRNLDFIHTPSPIDRFIINEIAGLVAPEAKLRNFPFGAFMYGDTYFQDFAAGKPGALDKFIACFYQDRNKGFNPEAIEEHAKKISSIELDTRKAIAHNYVMLRTWLSKAFPYIFQKGTDQDKQSKDAGWVGVYDIIVGDDIVNHESYARIPTMTMLRYLNRKTKEYYKNGGRRKPVLRPR